MSEQTSRKKVVSRTVAIGLGMVCIILLVGLVGAILVYSPMINSKNNKISDLSQQITSLSTQVADLTSIANLTKSTIWINFKNVSIQARYENVWNFPANYAGYVAVHVSSNATVSDPNAPVKVSHTYVHVTYSSHGVHYDQYLYIYEADETVAFPVLPSSNIQISVGSMGAETFTDTITITYHY